MEQYFCGLILLSTIVGSVLGLLSNKKLDREINIIIDNSKTDGTDIWTE